MIRSPARAPRPRVCAHVSRMCVPAPGTRLPPRRRAPVSFYRFENTGGCRGVPPKSIHKQQSSQDPVRACVLSVVEIFCGLDLT